MAGPTRDLPEWSAKMWYCEGAVVRHQGGLHVALGRVTMAIPGDGASHALHVRIGRVAWGRRWGKAVSLGWVGMGWGASGGEVSLRFGGQMMSSEVW